jgi:hypothetical protein
VLFQSSSYPQKVGLISANILILEINKLKKIRKNERKKNDIEGERKKGRYEKRSKAKEKEK